MQLHGLLAGLDRADQVYNGINASIDKYIASQGIDAPPSSVYEPVWQPDGEQLSLDLQAAGITSVIWCIGFRPDFEWLDAPVFNGWGQPVHTRGVTQQKGLYFLGLPWQYTWGSGRFSGVSRDVAFLAERIDAQRELCPPLSSATTGTKPTHVQMAMAA